MKTKGMRHQLRALAASAGRTGFAYLMDMGTGKTWTAIADVERSYAQGAIEGMLVIAPKGVHTNWLRLEIPQHLGCEWVGAQYVSKPNRRQAAAAEALYAPRAAKQIPPLRIFVINIDALNTPAGFAAALKFCRTFDTFAIVDESSRIKTHNSKRTERVLSLSPHTKIRRILSGKPATNSPGDLFSQFEFLESGLLGTTSYRSFFARYAELIPETSALYKAAKERAKSAFANPQIVARDSKGMPKYRNLDKLQALIAPHSFRVMKAECLDLPPKVYQVRYFELDAAQMRIYTKLEDELRVQLEEDGEELTVTALARIVKLQQVTSGFVNIEAAPALIPGTKNPRLALLEEVIEDVGHEPFIIWARFTEEIRQICDLLRSLDVPFVQYTGATKDAERIAAIDALQNGRARAFVANPQAGGIGLTLTAAKSAIYYSNDYNLDTRSQSEDRNHRKGTTGDKILYVDLCASGTIDETIALALQRKNNMAAAIVGDLKKGKKV